MLKEQKIKDIVSLEEVLRQINFRMNYLTKNYLHKEGLTLPRYWVLLSLSQHDSLSMRALQEHILISAGSLTTLIDVLVDDGLVTRQRSETDRRLVVLFLTPTGKQLIQSVLSYRHTLLSQAFDNGNDGSPGTIEDMLPFLDKISYFLHYYICKQNEITT